MIGLAACGGGSSDNSSGQAAGTGTIRVVSSPIADYGPYWYAEKYGIFNKLNVKVKDVSLTGGAPGINALMGGSVDVVGTNSISSLQAIAAGNPVKLLAEVDENLTSGKDYYGIVTDPKSGVTTAAGLSGKAMSTNVAGSLNQIMTQAWLSTEGVSAKSVHFATVPFPEQGQALFGNQIQGALMGPPYLQQTVDKGAKIIGYPFQTVGKGTALPIVDWVTSTKFAGSNKAALTSFVRAMDEANKEFVDPANKDKAAAVLAEKTGMSAELIGELVLPTYTTKMSSQGHSIIQNVMRDQGLLPKAVNLPNATVSLG